MGEKLRCKLHGAWTLALYLWQSYLKLLVLRCTKLMAQQIKNIRSGANFKLKMRRWRLPPHFPSFSIKSILLITKTFFTTQERSSKKNSCNNFSLSRLSFIYILLFSALLKAKHFYVRSGGDQSETYFLIYHLGRLLGRQKTQASRFCRSMEFKVCVAVESDKKRVKYIVI